MNQQMMERASFTAMADGKPEDYAKCAAAARAEAGELPDRLMALLATMEGGGGFRIGRLEHSLQSATRALRDGRDDEYVACALLHDIGDMNHHFGRDRNVRDRFVDSPYYERTVEFCELYDQNSFDPDYDNLPLAHFEPLLRRVLVPGTEAEYRVQAR
jgi:predicted HD phosphohydrolase